MNLGAQTLKRKWVGTIDDLAAELRVHRTYAGRVLADKRVPGLAFRQKAKERFGIPLDHWDQQVPQAKPPRNLRKTGTDG